MIHGVRDYILGWGQTRFIVLECVEIFKNNGLNSKFALLNLKPHICHATNCHSYLQRNKNFENVHFFAIGTFTSKYIFFMNNSC